MEKEELVKEVMHELIIENLELREYICKPDIECVRLEFMYRIKGVPADYRFLAFNKNYIDRLKILISEYCDGGIYTNIGMAISTENQFEIIPFDLCDIEKLAQDYVKVHGCTIKQTQEKIKNIFKKNKYL